MMMLSLIMILNNFMKGERMILKLKIKIKCGWSPLTTLFHLSILRIIIKIFKKWLKQTRGSMNPLLPSHFLSILNHHKYKGKGGVMPRPFSPYSIMWSFIHVRGFWVMPPPCWHFHTKNCNPRKLETSAMTMITHVGFDVNFFDSKR